MTSDQRPENAVPTDEDRRVAQEALRKMLDDTDLPDDATIAHLDSDWATDHIAQLAANVRRDAVTVSGDDEKEAAEAISESQIPEMTEAQWDSLVDCIARRIAAVRRATVERCAEKAKQVGAQFKSADGDDQRKVIAEWAYLSGCNDCAAAFREMGKEG